MKILQIITLGDSIGGAQIHVLDLTKGLKQRGHDVFVLTGTTGELNRRLNEAGIPNETMPLMRRAINLYWDTKCFFALRKFIKNFKPDVVASHSSKAGMLVRLVCFSLGQANTFTVHGWAFGEAMPFLRRNFFIAVEFILRFFSDAVINVSTASQRLGKKYNLISPHHSTVIYNGVTDFAKQRPSLVHFMEEMTDLAQHRQPIVHFAGDFTKGELEDDDDDDFWANEEPIELKNWDIADDSDKPFVMVMSARFQEPKNHERLLHALNGLKKDNWVLYLLGDGTDTLGRVKELTALYNFEQKVKFIGYVQNVVPYLESADLFLLISDWEGLPLSIIEAMSLSLPVVATRVGGIPEQIEHGKNGLLVERTDTEGLTKAIETLQNDPDLRKRMGQAARTFFENKFQLDNMIDRTENLYYSVLRSVK
jgi:glycosyltransferase involved in cell wall biosynthesis